VDDYKAVSLKVLFSNSLILSLHKDLCLKINKKISIDIDAIECRIHGDVNQDFELDTPTADHDIQDLLDEDQLMHDMENADNSGNGSSQQEDEDENARDEGAKDENQVREDLPGEEHSGFKKQGCCTVYSSTKFWKFVDDSLEGIHKLAKTQVSE